MPRALDNGVREPTPNQPLLVEGRVLDVHRNLFFAASPIIRSSAVNATHDVVVRLPRSFAMIMMCPFLSAAGRLSSSKFG